MNVIIVTNHLQHQDGVCKAAIGMANALSHSEDCNVTLCPLFNVESSMFSALDEKVTLKPVFRAYFRGFQRIVDLIPKSLLHKLIIGDEYDVEIGYCMRMPIQIVAAANKGRSSGNRRRFAWMHGYDAGLTLRSEYERIGRVICVSKHIADRLQAESGGSFAVDYAYNLLDDEDIRNKGAETIPVKRSKDVQFVTVGRMTPEKGYIRLLECCRKLKDEGCSFNLWLIGDGPQRKWLEAKARDLDVADVALFLGQQSNPHAYTAKSDVFICSSFDEGYSTACTEAIILGVPVVTTDVSGAQEIIDEAKCGLIVQKNDDDALYRAMKTVIDNQQLISEWKDKLKNTSERFSYKHRATKLCRILGAE